MEDTKYSNSNFDTMDEDSNSDCDDIDSAWSKFCTDSNSQYTAKKLPSISNSNNTETMTTKECIPKSSMLNISTKTKIAYLNYPIDLKDVFWAIPLINYYEPSVGIIKKQMKFNSITPAEVDEIIKEKEKYECVDDYIISQINATEGRTKFKDIRKISIGVCRKDIISYRCKRKSAFYNCFVVILRVLRNNAYKEIHVKVFNTGKMEIPGIQDSTILNEVLTLLVKILTPLVDIKDDKPLEFLDNKSETVMINSNFNCGYYINREKMYKLLKTKYKINSNFDPCSYPGIQCEFYHDSVIKEQHGVQPTTERNASNIKTNDAKQSSISKISFMIFRTGSVLIVGKCSEEILYEIYHFLCNIFEIEYDEIRGTNLLQDNKEKDKEITKKNTRKVHKRIIMFTNE